MLEVENFNQYNEIVDGNDAVVFYFSHEKCNVCKVLKPKIGELLAKKFPKMPIYYCDTVKTPEIAAQNQVFTVPTILVYFAGKESFRKSRNIGINELETSLQRPYSLMFG